MFCRQCGSELKDGEKFCRMCGAPAPQRDPSPETETKAVREMASPAAAEAAPAEKPADAPAGAQSGASGQAADRGNSFAPEKKSRKGLLIGLIAAAAAAVVVFAVIVPMARRSSARKAEAEALAAAQQYFETSASELQGYADAWPDTVARAEELLATVTEDDVTDVSYIEELQRAYDDSYLKDFSVYIPEMASTTEEINAQAGRLQEQISEMAGEGSLIRAIDDIEWSMNERKEQRINEQLDQIVSESSTVIDTLTGFSFGLLDGSCTREGHTVYYRLQYTTDLGAMEDLTSSGLEATVGLVEGTINSYIDQLQASGASDISFVVEFKNYDGDVLFSRTFS